MTEEMDRIHKKRISFVFPVYNEEYVIEKTLSSYYNEFYGKIDFEMIVAEDGSTDNTKNILKKMSSKLPLRLYMDKNRKGYLRAIKDALGYARYEWIFLVDSDHQFEPKDFWKLWPHTKEYDIILGIKKYRQDGPLRAFLSKGYNLILRILFRVPYVDMDTGFRLLKKAVVDELAHTIDKLGYFTAEFVIRANNKGYKILEVPVQHFNQKIRSSNIFHLNKLPSIIIKELIGIAKLFYEIRLKLKIQHNHSKESR